MTTDVEALRYELQEAAALLSDLQKGAKALLTEPPIKKVRQSKPRAEVKTSSWALSGTTRRLHTNTGKVNPCNSVTSNLNVAKAEEKIKTAVPMYSFPKSTPPPLTPSSLTPINPSINSISTKKRSISVSIAPKSSKPVRRAPAVEVTASLEARPTTADNTSSNKSKVYSFAKDTRLKPDKAILQPESLPLDSLSAFKATKPKGPAAVIASSVLAVPESSTEEPAGIPPPSSAVYSVDVLSYRMRVTNVPFITKTHRSRVPLASTAPGPLAYDSLPVFGEDCGRTAVMRDVVQLRPQARVALHRQRKPAPGPGDYDVDSADRYLQHVPSVDMSRAAESKSDDDRLAWKRYWEDKARDAREDHDDMRETNIDLVRPRTPTVTFARPSARPSPRSSSQSFLEEIDSFLGIDPAPPQPQYDVKYNLVEKRIPVAVNMTRESAEPKPRRIDEAADKLYGPQLHVPWLPEESVKQKKNQVVDEEDSPTRLIADLFPAESRAEAMESEFTSAFLKSSLTGVKRSAFRFDASPAAGHPTQDVVVDTREVIGPRDWMAEASSGKYKNLALSFDLHRGRDTIRVDGKNKILRIPFHALPEPTDALGPGVYTQDEGFGAAVKGVLAFSKLSEPLPSLRKDMHAEQLDLDVDGAYERLNNMGSTSMKLYVQDRHAAQPEAEAKEELDLGDRGFHGFAEAATTKTTVNFSKMSGRVEAAQGFSREGEGEILDLAVEDWKPHARATPAFTFPDPAKAPRFVAQKVEERPLELDVKYTHKDPKPVVLVDMAKQLVPSMTSVQDDYDQGIVMEVIRERDAKYHAAMDRRFRSAPLVNMAKGSSREDSLLAEEKHILDLDVNHEVIKPRVKDAVVMAKQAGRPVAAERDPEEEELILSPKHEAISKRRAVSSGVAWSALEERTKPPNFLAADQEELDLGPADPTLFKKGFKSGPTLNMAKHSGRVVPKSDKDQDAEAKKKETARVKPNRNSSKGEAPIVATSLEAQEAIISALTKLRMTNNDAPGTTIMESMETPQLQPPSPRGLAPPRGDDAFVQ